ncbi:hypothetical protein NDU88_004995 [Pleurodeles waltl]|uniref:Uncharacterized protein n=1 Tax=Pleurodeles waltl TaxID=8319 RepID=A0AAV7TTJ7_PLEWA|nr:hypothetical protein NDU88_004995 [Pleurodeles waltl]
MVPAGALGIFGLPSRPLRLWERPRGGHPPGSTPSMSTLGKDAEGRTAAALSSNYLWRRERLVTMKCGLRPTGLPPGE